MLIATQTAGYYDQPGLAGTAGDPYWSLPTRRTAVNQIETAGGYT